MRRRSLEISKREHRATGAYDLLAVPAKDDTAPNPLSLIPRYTFVYLLDFPHKIERLKVYIACCHHGSEHTLAFLICRKCRAVGEADASQVEVRSDVAAQAVGFQIERTVVEAEGLSQNCQDAA